jgi:hypothetical protein
MRTIARMMVLLVMTCLSADLLAQTPPNAADNAATAQVGVGKVDLMEGDVRLFDSQMKLRAVQVGNQVFEGDSIVTGTDGEIHLTMADEGYIAVRPNTKMRIAQYRANGDDQDRGLIGLLSGSLRSITGWIGKYRPKAYVIRTPTATIGIRGTDHEPKVIPEGSAEGDPGTYDKVNAGGTTLRTPQGSVDVTPNHAAYASRRGGGPRVLDKVPSFFKPTRNEHLIEGKHDQIQRTMEKKREERRQQVKTQGRPQANSHGKSAVNAVQGDHAKSLAGMGQKRNLQRLPENRANESNKRAMEQARTPVQSKPEAVRKPDQTRNGRTDHPDKRKDER